MTWSSSSTVYDQTNTFTKDRSLTFSSGSGSFRATGFTGTLASADGTVANDGYHASTYSAEDASGTYEQVGDAIVFTLADGSVVKSRFFTLVENGKQLWIYVGGYGYLSLSE